MIRLQIGSVNIDSKLVLAPMAGVTDLAFRTICRELGAGYTITEMVSTKALCYQDKKTLPLMELGPDEHPAGVQVFGSDLACMEEAAAIIREVARPDIIDINMGCPVPKVANNGDGSGLLKDLDKACRVAEAVIRGAKGTPVTVKMRLGWDKGNIVCLELSKLLESVGVSALTVHGRTKVQAQAAIAGKPIPPLPPLAERCKVAVRQFELAAKNKSEKIACLEARKHYAWYLKGVPYAGYWKSEISKITTLEDVYRVTAGIQRELKDPPSLDDR